MIRKLGIVIAVCLCTPVLADDWNTGVTSATASGDADNWLQAGTTRVDYDDDVDTSNPVDVDPDQAFLSSSCKAKSDVLIDSTAIEAGTVRLVEVDMDHSFVGGSSATAIDTAEGNTQGQGNAYMTATSSAAGEASGNLYFNVDLSGANQTLPSSYSVTATVGPNTITWTYDKNDDEWTASGTYYVNDNYKNAANELEPQSGKTLFSSTDVSWDVEDDEYITMEADADNLWISYEIDSLTLKSGGASVEVEAELDDDIY